MNPRNPRFLKLQKPFITLSTENNIQSMQRLKKSIFLSLLLAAALCSCGKDNTRSKLLINEVLIENESSCQDEYGIRSGWIEIFNRTYGSADLSGGLLRSSCRPGDTVTYFIPKGDVQTVVKPRQHTIFWTDASPRKGTFHTNFTLDPETSCWLGLYDSGGKLLNQVTIPANAIKADESYARVSDASEEWEVKDGQGDKYVTPSTNNKTIESNAKVDKFAEHDASGVGMAISAMSVVFSGLLILFICFRFLGRQTTSYSSRKRAKRDVLNKEHAEAKEKKTSEHEREVAAAIAMALHEAFGEGHDAENARLTITHIQQSSSPWSSKQQTLRQMPVRK